MNDHLNGREDIDGYPLLSNCDFLEMEKAAREVMAIPIYPELTDEMKGYVVKRITEFLE